MARQTGFFHHIGSFLLLAATVLLIVTCISAPVVNHLAVLKVRVNDASQNRGEINFGTFGYCVDNVDSSVNGCTRSHVGYDAASLIQRVPGSDIDLSDASAKTANALTKVMILHPVACGLSFIAFLMALGAGVIGSFLASLVALLAFLVTLVVLITDFVGLALLRNAVNNHSDVATARYGAAAWTLLASAVCNLLATIVVFFTCCSARLHKRRNRNVANTKAERYDSPPRTTSTRRWF